jgi:hypothetical protein
MYENGEMAQLIRKWGGDPKQFLRASQWMVDMRQGVDRPSDWRRRRYISGRRPGILAPFRFDRFTGRRRKAAATRP